MWFLQLGNVDLKLEEKHSSKSDVGDLAKKITKFTFYISPLWYRHNSFLRVPEKGYVR